MSYLPIPRCISIGCYNDPNDLTYFAVLTVSQADYNYFMQYSLAPDAFETVSLENGVLQYKYIDAYVFTDPAGGPTADLLLPCCPNNGPAATSFVMNYYSGTGIYQEGDMTQCPISDTRGTINPPQQKPGRDMSDDSGDPCLFFLQSATDANNVSLGVASSIPPNINPRLNLIDASQDPTVLTLEALTLINSNAYDIAVFNIQPLGSYTTVTITFPDNSVSSAQIGPMTPTFII